MKASEASPGKRLAVNRRALHEYFVTDRLEAGLALQGSEVKSVREGNLNLTGSFAGLEDGQAMLMNLHIAPYEHGGHYNHEPLRPRRLLLHRREIRRLEAHVEQKGFTLIPLAVYLKHGLVKVELGLCKGKRQYDKREDLKRKDADREVERAKALAR